MRFLGLTTFIPSFNSKIATVLGTIACAMVSPAVADDAMIQSLIKQVAELQRAVQGSQTQNALTKQVAALQQAVQGLQTQNALLQGKITALEASTTGLRNEVVTYLRPLEPYVAVDTSTLNGLVGPHIILTGANVHIRSGKGPLQNSTAASGCPANGLCDGSGLASYVNGVGNLILGYNEMEPPPYRPQIRTGSHNLVMGFGHEFTGNGGFVTGLLSVVSGASTTVSGGFQNEASGIFTSVSGGAGNKAINQMTSISGGVGNTATGYRASVSGGQNNTASGQSSSVSGGDGNIASGFAASISSGGGNLASGSVSSISGGGGNLASGDGSSVSGGSGNQATGASSSVTGGASNAASAGASSVTGGISNRASHTSSSISGGSGVFSSGEGSWAAGTLRSPSP